MAGATCSGAAMARDPKQPRRRGGMSDAAKYVSMAMLAIIALAVLSLILMFCGVAAVSAIDDFGGARSNLVAFTWALLLFYAILLVLILLVVLMGWKRPKMARRLHLSLIVFLAIMIAWLGTQADKATAAERSLSGTSDTRAGVWAAGLIMCAVTACLLLLGLLALEAMMSSRHGDTVRSPEDSAMHAGEAMPVGGAADHRAGSPAPATLSVGSQSAVTPSPGSAAAGTAVPVEQLHIPQPPAGGAQPMMLSGGAPHAAGTQPQADGVPGTVVHDNQTYGKGVSVQQQHPIA